MSRHQIYSCILVGFIALGLLQLPRYVALAAPGFLVSSSPSASTDGCPSTGCQLYLPFVRHSSPGVQALAIQDSTLFAAFVADPDTLVTYAIQANGQLVDANALPVDRPIIDLAVAGDIVYVLTKDAQAGELLIVDGARTGQLALRGRYDQLTFPTQLVVDQGLAYVVNGSNRITVIDVGTPDIPKQRSTYTLNGSNLLTDLAVRNGIGYLAADQFVTVDFRSPGQPIQLAQVTLPGIVRAVAVHDDVAYVGSYFDISSIVSVRDPRNPVSIGTYTNKFMYPGRNIVIGTTLFVRGAWSRYGDCTTATYDITDMARPREIAPPYIDHATCINDTVAVGQWLYIADAYRGLQTISIGS